MSLPTLATVGDLADHLSRSVEEGPALFALRTASGKVRDHTGQTISLVVGDAVDLAPVFGTVLRLPQRPVVAVVSVLVDGVAIAPSLYRRRGDRLIRSCGWPAGAVVTYTHGWADIPDGIVGVVCELAGMGVANPTNMRSLSIDDYTETYAAETIGSAELTEGQKATLKSALRRRGAFSVRPS